MMEPSALGSAETHISFQANLELPLSQTASIQYVQHKKTSHKYFMK
jgi:hypothetical protein